MSSFIFKGHQYIWLFPSAGAIQLQELYLTLLNNLTKLVCPHSFSRVINTFGSSPVQIHDQPLNLAFGCKQLSNLLACLACAPRF